jgi:hypothetical protein
MMVRVGLCVCLPLSDYLSDDTGTFIPYIYLYLGEAGKGHSLNSGLLTCKSGVLLCNTCLQSSHMLWIFEDGVLPYVYLVWPATVILQCSASHMFPALEMFFKWEHCSLLFVLIQKVITCISPLNDSLIHQIKNKVYSRNLNPKEKHTVYLHTSGSHLALILRRPSFEIGAPLCSWIITSVKPQHYEYFQYKCTLGQPSSKNC